MQFLDKTRIIVSGGKGGDGVVAYRREKYVRKGGPSGGDGGKGGDVFLRANENINSLNDLHDGKSYKAEDGVPGGYTRMTGADGKDLYIEVPVGTQVFEERDEIKKLKFDLANNNDACLLVRGGTGGLGNWHFRKSTLQTPNFAELGEPGEKKEFFLELKIIANVGIIGLPNAGKSSLISSLSNAKPKIANYPFTTLVPVLGSVKLGEKRLSFADTPGLIKGASSGKGLGFKFLQHIERCSNLIQLIDINDESAISSFEEIENELSQYDESFGSDISKKPRIVALSKSDSVTIEDAKKIKTALEKELKKVAKRKPNIQSSVFLVSAQSHLGLKEMTAEAFKMHREAKHTHDENLSLDSNEDQPHSVFIDESDSPRFRKRATVWLEGETVFVLDPGLSRIAVKTNFDLWQARERLRQVLVRKGILTRIKSLLSRGGKKIDFGQVVVDGDVLLEG